jgi:phenylacetaldehyde dehydrogenase
VEPTLLTNVQPGMKVHDEEIFGPVVCALPFDKTEEVAGQMNQSAYGLAGAVWTKDISKAHRLAKAMRAGTVWINCYNVFDAALPFGGYKQSGWGREMGREVFENYTEVKAVCLKM